MTILLSQGHDTTSAAICWALYLLGRHPDVQVKRTHNRKGNYWTKSCQKVCLISYTIAVICWTLFLLGLHPDVQVKRTHNRKGNYWTKSYRLVCLMLRNVDNLISNTCYKFPLTYSTNFRWNRKWLKRFSIRFPIIIHCKFTYCQSQPHKYSRIPFIGINWDGESTGYADNPDNWNFLLKMGYIVSLQFGCYYLQYVPASKPF
jgi:hypothetical protein